MFTKLAKFLSPGLRKEEGFTLIELLIVVAIIAILAAIAIPQFAAYRMRGYNAAGASDLRNAKTAEEAHFADTQIYGITVANATLVAAPGGAGAGTLRNGPVPAATATAAGAMITGTHPTTAAIGAIGIAISNGVNLQANTLVGNASHIVVARHELGDTAYGGDSDSTALYNVKRATWAGILDVISATIPATTTGTDDFNGFDGGGAPTANWTAM